MKNLLLTLCAVLCFTAVFAQLNIAVTTQSNVSCFGGSDGFVNVTATGGTLPYTYIWSPFGLGSDTIANLPAGSYTVTVTDGSSNTATTTAIVTQPTEITTFVNTNPASCGTPNGSAVLSVTGGTPSYTFQWNNGSNSPQIGNLPAGVYWVTVMDANGCAVADTAFVGGGTNLIVNTSVVYDSCQGTACVFAQVPGTNPFYQWSNGATTPQICGLNNGNYTVTVSDINGCTATQSVTVINQTALIAAAASTPATCGNDGSVVTTVSGGAPPYTYTWNNGATTSQLINLPAGNYTATITDANGCSTTASTTVASGSFTIGSANTSATTCQTATNGSAAIIVTGTNPPFTYAWSNSATTNTISGLSPGTYVVTVTDNGGCILVQTFQVLASNLQVNTSVLVPANCATGTGGILQAAPLNGDAPYSYVWSNGSTADTATSLAVGGHTVTVTDGNGCEAIRHQFITTTQNCYTRISGTVYFDADSDCDYTAADFGVSGVMVKVEPGYYAYTQPNGNWSTTVRQGSYSVSVPNVGQAANLLNTCGIDTLPINAVDTNAIVALDFPKTATNTNDISVSVYCGVARPGFTQANSITIKNEGFTTADFSGSIVLDGIFTIAPTMYNLGGVVVDSITFSPTTVHFSYSGLAPQQQTSFSFYTTIPTIPTVTLGQTVTHTATVNLVNNTDQNTLNNSSLCSKNIVGSYDPNDKQVFNTNNESIDGPATVEDTLLRYLIRFQNTGTDTAFTVIVRDTLDEHLNISSFRYIAASHDVEIEFFEERIVHFIFNNILLPDSNVNEPGSHGFVEFDIEVLDKTQLDEVSNQAAIYFDFNPPIYTNTVTTSRIVGIAETVKVPVHVFPNPTTGLLSVNLGGLPIEHVEMFDVMGRKVLQQSASNTLQANIDGSSLGNGIYIVRIQSGGTWYQSKVVVAK